MRTSEMGLGPYLSAKRVNNETFIGLSPYHKLRAPLTLPCMDEMCLVSGHLACQQDLPVGPANIGACTGKPQASSLKPLT